MIVFVIFAYLEKSSLKIEPKSAQHTVDKNAVMPSREVKKRSALH